MHRSLYRERFTNTDSWSIGFVLKTTRKGSNKEVRIKRTALIEDISHFQVVCLQDEERFYVAGTFSRRLCAYRLLAIYALIKLRLIKVHAVPVVDPCVHFDERKTTQRQAQFAYVRQGREDLGPKLVSTPTTQAGNKQKTWILKLL